MNDLVVGRMNLIDSKISPGKNCTSKNIDIKVKIKIDIYNWLCFTASRSDLRHHMSVTIDDFEKCATNLVTRNRTETIRKE